MKKLLINTYVFVSILFIGILIGHFHGDSTDENHMIVPEMAVEVEDLAAFQASGSDARADLESKQEQMSEQESFNVFSSAGRSIADTVTVVTAFFFHE
ncbi:hypothetical protein JOC78_002963 [Bacillus ectoiniformans]|uniref:hypothetical protein n=1 Tax=Bacillus ectoiniformans TaxID=1494429 RepID=UPI00195C9E7B|nr:hypothetical protein [Bacillus ectoiniformans]MBM7649979.1 hypothetical protein [Bacillus ectoiniformans]